MTQSALPLEPTKPQPIREAFRRAGYAALGMTLEQAMSRPILALCLRNTAEAITRKEAK